LARTQAASGAAAALARRAAASAKDAPRVLSSRSALAAASALIWLASRHLGTHPRYYLSPYSYVDDEVVYETLSEIFTGLKLFLFNISVCANVYTARLM
jgi:hypothetical protein